MRISRLWLPALRPHGFVFALTRRIDDSTTRWRPPQVSAFYCPADRLYGRGTPVRAAVDARLRSGFEPRPAGHSALFTRPLMAVKPTRWRRGFEVPFGARHPPGACVPRDLERIPCTFGIRTVRPRTGELPVLVAMLRTGLHCIVILERVRGRPAAECRRRLRRSRPTAGRSPSALP